MNEDTEAEDVEGGQWLFTLALSWLRVKGIKSLHAHTWTCVLILLDQEYSLLASSSILLRFQLGNMDSILCDLQASPTVTKFPAE